MLDGCGSECRSEMVSYEYHNETLGSIKGRQFLDQLCIYQYLSKGSPPWCWFGSYFD
jgi:hypothetical protein